MGAYLLRRLLLLPITLFFILVINFVIISQAPGDPVTLTQSLGGQEALRVSSRAFAFGSDLRYLQFRERFGLTLPVLLNTWSWITLEETQKMLETLLDDQQSQHAKLKVSDYHKLRIKMGDQSKFVMRHLMTLLEAPSSSEDMQALVVNFIIRGAFQQPILGSALTKEERVINKNIAEQMLFLSEQRFLPEDIKAVKEKKKENLKKWFEGQKHDPFFYPTPLTKVFFLFFETRFFKYMQKVVTLDFGTVRDDEHKTVISEVGKRMKYSLTLSILPLLMTFVLCQCFGFAMAFWKDRWQDHLINVVFLILYAIPVFVAGPFVIEKWALHHTFPGTKIPIPISGFTSPDLIYFNQSSWERLVDILQHITLPLVVLLYGSLAAQARISRTAFVEVMHQDFVRTAQAKGVPLLSLWIKHIGRAASITIVTSIAGSLGAILGGSLIVETLFQIDGFGRFFYEAVINRDYNVILFSALAGSFLTLIGYLMADIAYALLDPRIDFR